MTHTHTDAHTFGCKQTQTYTNKHTQRNKLRRHEVSVQRVSPSSFPLPSKIEFMLSILSPSRFKYAKEEIYELCPLSPFHYPQDSEILFIADNIGGNKPVMLTRHARWPGKHYDHRKHTTHQLMYSNKLCNGPRSFACHHGRSLPSGDTLHRRLHPKAREIVHRQLFSSYSVFFDRM